MREYRARWRALDKLPLTFQESFISNVLRDQCGGRMSSYRRDQLKYSPWF